MKRTLAFVVVMATMVVGLSGVASADPKAESFVLTCEGVPSGEITANGGNGIWTPGFATASTGVYIPYYFEFDATFTSDQGIVTDLGTDIFSKNAPKNNKAHDHGVCTFSGEESVVDDPDFGTGVFHFDATVELFWTGK